MSQSVLCESPKAMPSQQDDLETALYKYWIVRGERIARIERQSTQTEEDKAALFALMSEEIRALRALKKIPGGHERSCVPLSLSDLRGQDKYAALVEQRRNAATLPAQEAKESSAEAGQQEDEPGKKSAKKGGKHVRFA